MPTSSQACLLPLLVLCLSVVTRAPAASATATVTTVRATTWFDVNRPYLYVYGVSPAICAASLNFTAVPDADVTNVGRLSLASVFEDGFQCAGASPLVVLTAAALTIPGLLDRVGLSDMYTTVTTTNANAAAIAKHPSAQHMLVAWHGGPRSCGTSVHPSSTVYFFVRQEDDDDAVASGYTIDFDHGGSGSSTEEEEEEEGSNGSFDRLFIPNGVPALLVVPNSADICVYVGIGDDLGLDVTKTITLATGDAPPIPLAPSNPRTPTVTSVPPPPDNSTSTGSTTESGVPAIDASSVTNPDSGTGSGTVVSSSGMDIELTPIPTYEASDMTEDGVDPLPGETPLPSNSPSPSMNTAAPVTGAGTDVDVDTNDDEDDTVPIVTSAVEDTDGDGGRACFPGGARVLLFGGHSHHHHQRHRHDRSALTSRSIPTSMSELKIGQAVHGGGPVLFFTHRDARVRAPFVRLSWRNGESILVSHGHYLYVYTHTCSSVRLKSTLRLRRAADIKVGDALVDGVTGLPRTVRSIDQVCALGLYNPQTETGVIIVDGVRASTYTSAVHPSVAHWLVTRPVKWALCVIDAATTASGRKRRGRRRTGAAEWLSWVMRRGLPRFADVFSMVADIAEMGAAK